MDKKKIKEIQYIFNWLLNFLFIIQETENKKIIIKLFILKIKF
jgi:hypothetical protein